VLGDFVIFPDNDPADAFTNSWKGFVEAGSGEAMPDFYVQAAPKESEDSKEYELAFDKKPGPTQITQLLSLSTR
jgi:hypothetical protein